MTTATTQQTNSLFYNHVIEMARPRVIRTYQQEAIHTIETGTIDDPEHTLNDKTVTVTFFGSDDFTVDVELDIDWTESSEGFDFELTASSATYWDGSQMVVIDFYKEENADLAVTARNQALPVITERDVLHDTKTELEDTATFGW